ncbi:MAG: xylulokinase [Clostridiales Family XIII bacterium]|nr:xylulokinase [Clostridiales Family XIII bacterium]
MKYLIGTDLGTSATKTVLFDENGTSIASASIAYPLHQPRNGWAEQDPLDWWNACVSTLRRVIAQSGVSTADIAGIGLSGQMHGLVMLDENGETLRNSIIWCDGRTTAECAEITEKIGARRLIEITANPALTGFTAGKILWVRKNEPELYERCRHILLPKDYLRYKLTGEFAAEMSDASGMNLLDVPNRRWSGEVLEKLDIDPALLPPVRESYEIAGHITAESAALTGLAAGTPVVGGAGDNAAAAIGTGVVKSGKAFVTIGTSGVIFAHSDRVTIDPSGRVHTFCSAVPGAWTVMSCTLSAGGSLQWFRNNFCAAEIETAAGLGKDPYELTNGQAERIPIGADRLLFLPYLMGERSPLLDADARGVFFGLSAMHTRQHMLRAVMEGVSYSQRQCIDVLRSMGVLTGEILATGGGARSPLWRQMLADLFECPVATVENSEGSALGAAILAGVGTGLYANLSSACENIIKVGDLRRPVAANTEAYEPYYRLYREIYPQLTRQFRKLAAL